MFTMSFELGAEAHFFTTFITFISTLILLIMGSHVRVGIMLVFVFVITFVTTIPTAFGVDFDVTIQVSSTLKFLVAALFGQDSLLLM